MSFKKLTNFYVFILSILTVNLLSDKITGLVLSWKFTSSPVKATVVGMLVLVFILFPAFTFLQTWSDKTALKIFKIGKNAGGKFFGVTLAFLFCLFVLFLFYLGDWYGKSYVWNWLWSLMPS